jgi:hypothetical protein
VEDPLSVPTAADTVHAPKAKPRRIVDWNRLPQNAVLTLMVHWTEIPSSYSQIVVRHPALLHTARNSH